MHYEVIVSDKRERDFGTSKPKTSKKHIFHSKQAAIKFRDETLATKHINAEMYKVTKLKGF